MDFVTDFIAFAPVLLRGLGMTLLLTLAALPLSLALGIVLALGTTSAQALPRVVATSLVTMVRGVPIIVQLFCVYFVLPEFGISLLPFAAGVVGLGIAYSVYQAENFRAGFQAVDRQLVEAGRSLGMTEGQVFRRIVLPLGLRIALPTFGNTTIMLLKDSSIASTISIAELTREGQLLAIATFRNGSVYLLVGLFYLAASLPLTYAVKALERKLART